MGRRWVRLELSVDDFDPAPFRARAAAALGQDVSVTTMAELGGSEDHQRRLWELDRVCSADVPDHDDFFTFEEYRDIRLGKASARPDGQVVAIDQEGAWVGLCLVAHNPGGDWAFVDMTGVLPGHRRRGLSVAMKLPVVETVRRWGVPALRTFHHPDNDAAIAANLALGFRHADFAMPVPIPDPD